MNNETLNIVVTIIEQFRYGFLALLLLPLISKLISGYLEIAKERLRNPSSVDVTYSPLNNNYSLRINSNEKVGNALAKTLKELNSSRRNIKEDHLLLDSNREEA